MKYNSEFNKIMFHPLLLPGTEHHRNTIDDNENMSQQFSINLEYFFISIWQVLFQQEYITTKQNFYELGGDSILAMKFVAQAKSHGINVSFSDILRYSTIASLVHQLSSRNTQEDVAERNLILNKSTSTNLQPLSYNQLQLWLVDKLLPPCTYNMLYSFHASGDLKLDYWQQALKAVINRQTSLRTRFVIKHGEIAQLIDDEIADGYFVYHDLRNEPDDKRAQIISELDKAINIHVIDLQQGPLLRCDIIHIDKSAYIIYFTIHHIISDDWSWNIFIREMNAFYNHYAIGLPLTLPALPAQYVDYTLWQHNHFNTKRIKQQLSYWGRTLKNCPEESTLPTDRPRPIIASHQGALMQFSLSKEITYSLKKLCAEQQISLFMMLMAGLQILLYRYTHQEDVVIGFPSAGRIDSTFENVIGYFVNTIVVRGYLGNNPSVIDYLQIVKLSILDAYDYQETPFTLVVDHLHHKHHLGRNPIFQILFALQNHENTSWQLHNTKMVVNANDRQKSIVDIWISAREVASGEIIFSCEYAKELYDRTTIQRFGNNYTVLMQNIVNYPQMRINEIEIINLAEKKMIFADWNNTLMDYPKDKTIHQLFEEQVENTPDNIAVVFEQNFLTYRQLNQHANQLAHYLKDTFNLQPGTAVLIYLERSLELIIALFAILKTGGTYVPLDMNNPPARQNLIIQDTQCGIMITQSNLAIHNAEILMNYVYLDKIQSTLMKEPTTNLSLNMQHQLMAYILYTSGSTGRPKGVLIRHFNVVNLLFGLRNRIKISENERVLAATNIGFDIAALEIFWPLMNGSRLYFASQHIIDNAILLKKMLSEDRITFFQATPTRWQLLLDAGWQPTADMTMLCGGEALPFTLKERLIQNGGLLFQLYGPTETTIWSSISVAQPTASITLGRPLANTQFYVLNEQQQPVPIGVYGELYIGGDGVAKGYLNNPQLNEERFIQAPSEIAIESGTDKFDTHLYRTGDRVRYLANGELEFAGRLDSQVKINGFRVELAEIERALCRQKDVNTAAVMVHNNYYSGKDLIAYVVPHQPLVTPFELHDFQEKLMHNLEAFLPYYMIPQKYIFKNKLPINTNGKIDRTKLYPPNETEQIYLEHNQPFDYNNHVDNGDFSPLHQALQKRMKNIWKSVLKIDNIESNSNFFSLGGNSLRAMSLYLLIQKNFGEYLSLANIFSTPTLSQLVNNLAKSLIGKSSTQPLLNICENMNSTPIFFIHPISGLAIHYLGLASYFQDYSLYGINNPYFGSQSRAFSCIEEMAAKYIEFITLKQSQGPYYIAGYSFGGIVALEILHQLQRHTELSNHIILIDSFNFTSIEHKKILSTYFSCEFKKMLDYMGIIPDSTEGKSVLHEYKNNQKLLLQYTPIKYNGIAHLLKAQDSGVNNLASYTHKNGFEKILPNLQLRIIPGNHINLFDIKNIDTTAKAIKQALEDVNIYK